MEKAELIVPVSDKNSSQLVDPIKKPNFVIIFILILLYNLPQRDRCD